ncbi:ANTAR domain-containing protein [Streptomyces olivoreticuli]|uniref:ANTAR domain-containing protein n=1 Tax=Streptomyces olivoreticuli TaxID=68246 RepID=UPI000E2591D4|nr:ANTAR domain-containing protein [Streptomyces olivoreticuli]
MTVEGGSSNSSSRRAEAAWQRAALARERAAQQGVHAERHERRAEETGREFHTSMASMHRRTADRHIAAARLQETFARRMADGPTGRGARPVFMTGVAEACGTRSAALTLIGTDLSQLAVAASDRLSRTAQDLEYVLGAGPAREAARDRRPVAAVGPDVEKCWPGYGSGLASLGLSLVVAMPLTTPVGCIGALTVFDPRPGLAESGVFDEVAAALTDSVLLGPDADAGLYGDVDHRPVVHQAAGMLSEQVRCPVGDALALIKARAFALGEPPESIAQRIVSGDLKLS